MNMLMAMRRRRRGARGSIFQAILWPISTERQEGPPQAAPLRHNNEVLLHKPTPSMLM